MHTALTESVIQCPVCSSTYVRPVLLEIQPPGISGCALRVDASGVRLDNATYSGRGVTIQIHYACEAGHTFMTDMEFHKGITGTRTYVTGDTGPIVEPIWRD